MLPSWQVFLSGVALGITIAAPPGPVNATSASQATRSWLSGWLVLLGATTADGVFFVLTYYGLTELVASETVKEGLFLVGGILMFYLAVLTLRNSKNPLDARPHARRGFPYLLGFTIGISNPFQLAWWLTVGVGMVSAFGFSIVLGFFSGIVAWTVLFATLIRTSISRYERSYKVIIYASAAILVVFGAWFLYSSISALL